MASTWTQFFPPKPAFTDKDIPSDLQGKVYLISGANSGIGAELVRVLYAKDAKVYVACRSEEKAKQAIEKTQAAVPDSKGILVPLLLDQADLSVVKTAAKEVLRQETRLDVLFNNAGVMTGDEAETTAQGHELAMGVNCLGAFLLTKLLHPLLKSTAKREKPGAVRIVWLSSYGLVQYAPKERGIDMNKLDSLSSRPGMDRYGISKSGDWLLSVECARRYQADGIVSVGINPGNLFTSLARYQGFLVKFIARMVCYPVIFGVYTELYAAFSPDVTIEKFDGTKDWIIPWGRVAFLRPDLPKATRPIVEGGNGNAQEFWEWNEQQVREWV